MSGKLRLAAAALAASLVVALVASAVAGGADPLPYENRACPSSSASPICCRG